MHAILIGATGATGKDLLELLLKDNDFQQIDIFVRKQINLTDPKLNVNIIDFDQTEQWKHLVKGDVLFSCLGTTLKIAGSKEMQWKVDYDYQYQFAKAAAENGVSNYVLISSGFASSKSSFFYTKMKGKLEEDIKDLQFPKTIIFNPPVLERENSDRKMEVTGAKFIKFLNSFGLFRSQRPLSTLILAKAMISALKKLNDGIHSIKEPDISKIQE